MKCLIACIVALSVVVSVAAQTAVTTPKVVIDPCYSPSSPQCKEFTANLDRQFEQDYFKDYDQSISQLKKNNPGKSEKELLKVLNKDKALQRKLSNQVNKHFLEHALLIKLRAFEKDFAAKQITEEKGILDFLLLALLVENVEKRPLDRDIIGRVRQYLEESQLILKNLKGKVNPKSEAAQVFVSFEKAIKDRLTKAIKIYNEIQ